MRPRRGITFKLTLVFLTFAAVLLAGGGTLAYFAGRQITLGNMLTELKIASSEKQAALDEWVAHLRMDVVAMAKSPALVSDVQELLTAVPGSLEGQAAHIRAAAELHARVGEGQPYLRWLVIEPLEGRVIVDSDGHEDGKYREDRPYFTYGRLGPYVQNLYFSAALQAPAMTISAPLMNAQGHLVAVLAARLDLNDMNAIIQRRTGDRQTDDAYLVNASAIFVTQPRFISDPAVLSRGVHTVAVQRCLAGQAGVVQADDYRGVPVISNYTWMDARNMCLVVELDQAEAFAPVATMGRWVALGSGIALGVVAVIAVALARTITRPVRELQSGAARFARGELDVPLAETPGDELGDLAREFNTMAAALSQERAQLRHRLERMYGLSSDLICALGFDGYFKEVNPAFERVLGYRQDEMLTSPFIEFVHPDDRAATQAVAATLAEGQPLAGFENRYRCKDGSWKWLHWNASSDPRDQLIYGMARDVTDRKRVETEVQVLSSRNEAILGAVPDIIMQVDGQKVYTWANPAGIEFFGEGVLGKEAAFYFEGEQDTYALVKPLFDGKDETFYVESWQRRQDGEKRLLGWWCHVLTDAEGKVIGALSTARDITESKKAEVALQKTLADLERSNKELEQFAYVASHDLQEPLRMVSSYTQLLAKRLEGHLDRDTQDFIGFAVDGSNRMQRLIQDLLMYSRVTTRGRPYEPVDLHQVLGEAIANLQAAIAESGALVSNGDLPTLIADRSQLVQVFQNLIGNAIKFRKEGEAPRVHVTARSDGDEWVISVKDNGIGIDPKHFSRLFVIFQRLHGPQQYPGTGIGLALCQRIVARHGGRIWLESAPGQGSEFLFTLKA